MKQAIQISKHVYWVGAHDFNCRNFHGNFFPISNGTSYNAYLIVDDEITVIDTVEEEYMDIMLERIHSVIGDKKINHIIVQHAEPDHSSGFCKFMSVYPDAQPYASNAGVLSMLSQYFQEYPYKKVKTNDTLKTGNLSFTFVEMPLIHWPDNMLTYCPEEKAIFSNDAFGQHIPSYQMFDEFHGWEYCYECAKDYYANIVMPYGLQVMKKLDDLSKMNLEINYIAPSHGIIWKKYISEILNAYQSFASLQTSNKVVIVYESVWRHTQEIAEALAEGIGQNGTNVKVFKESCTSSAIIMKECLDADAILVGSGCYNNTMSHNIQGFLSKLKACNLKGKYGLGFGAYGWFKNTTNVINQQLQEAKLEIITDHIISQNYTPSKDELDTYISIGKEISNYIINKHKK